jgi:hypothetical protein
MANKSDDQKKYEEIRDRITFEFCRSIMMLTFITFLIAYSIHRMNLINVTNETTFSLVVLISCFGSLYSVYYFSKKQDKLMKKNGVKWNPPSDEEDYSPFTFTD